MGMGGESQSASGWGLKTGGASEPLSARRWGSEWAYPLVRAMASERWALGWAQESAAMTAELKLSALVWDALMAEERACQ